MIEETLAEATDKMDKAVEVAKEDFSTIRTGRATPPCSPRFWWTTTALPPSSSSSLPSRPRRRAPC
ncbi:hypothetical protein GCM10017708_39150 [Arthrobacter citreus]